VNTLAQLHADLAAGTTTSRGLTERCLDRIARPDGEGRRVFVRVFAEAARAAADAQDRLRAEGRTPSPVAGIPFAVKDLCDVVGYTTLAGSVALSGDPPADRDAPAVAQLLDAGMVLVGTTNMNEFALGTTGTNAHFGTPRNPWDRATGRIPGGSSSGCAVAVTDGMAAAALGTDTAGSVRIPSALCGLTGFKPTARRVPRGGVFPLSHSLDSVGPIGRSVACCATLDALLAGDESPELPALPLDGATFGRLSTLVLTDLEEPVARAYDAAMRALRASGASLVDLALPELEELPELSRSGGLALAEALAVHRERLDRDESRYDPIVAHRLRRSDAISPERYAEQVAARARIIAAVQPATSAFDAVLMPTCPLVAPPVSDLDDPERWMAVHARLVQSNGIANYLDRCALTVPIGEPGGAPVGLTLMGETLADRRLLAFGLSVERALADQGARPTETTR
jgi:aspartyl-tRNA(Asn)/glutamyl-tRNA(Gln) amidotransferase subunit A